MDEAIFSSDRAGQQHRSFGRADCRCRRRNRPAWTRPAQRLADQGDFPNPCLQQDRLLPAAAELWNSRHDEFDDLHAARQRRPLGIVGTRLAGGRCILLRAGQESRRRVGQRSEVAGISITPDADCDDVTGEPNARRRRFWLDNHQYSCDPHSARGNRRARATDSSWLGMPPTCRTRRQSSGDARWSRAFTSVFVG